MVLMNSGGEQEGGEEGGGKRKDILVSVNQQK